MCHFEKENETIITHHKQSELNPSELKDLIEQSLDMDKAEDILIIPLDEQSAVADYMIIATGTSSRHVNALSSKLKERLSSKGVKNITTEGLAQCDWVVMDAGDAIIHIFRPEVREFYNIEKMWCSGTPFDLVDNQPPLHV